MCLSSRVLIIFSNVLLSVGASVMGLYELVCWRSFLGLGMTVIVAVLNCGGMNAVRMIALYMFKINCVT